jgi:hypothetical protein
MVDIYKVNEIAEFTFTNPISNQDTSVNLKITKQNFGSFNAVLFPPTTENYHSIGVF